MRIIPVKFQPSWTKVVGRERGDRLVERIKPPFFIVLKFNIDQESNFELLDLTYSY